MHTSCIAHFLACIAHFLSLAVICFCSSGTSGGIRIVMTSFEFKGTIDVTVATGSHVLVIPAKGGETLDLHQ